MTRETLITYLQQSPMFTHDLLRALEYGCELADNPRDVELPQKIAARITTLGTMIRMAEELKLVETAFGEVA